MCLRFSLGETIKRDIMPRKKKNSKEEVDYHSLLSYFTHILFESYNYPLLIQHGVVFCHQESGVSNRWWRTREYNIMPFFEVLYQLEKQPDGVDKKEEERYNTECIKEEVIQEILESVRNSDMSEADKMAMEKHVRSVLRDGMTIEPIIHGAADEEALPIEESAFSSEETPLLHDEEQKEEGEGVDNWLRETRREMEMLKAILREQLFRMDEMKEEEEVLRILRSNHNPEQKKQSDETQPKQESTEGEEQGLAALLNLKTLEEKTIELMKSIGIPYNSTDPTQNEINYFDLEKLCFGSDKNK